GSATARPRGTAWRERARGPVRSSPGSGAGSPRHRQEVQEVLNPEDAARGPARRRPGILLNPPTVVEAIRVQDDLFLGVHDRLEEPGPLRDRQARPPRFTVPRAAPRLPAFEPQEDL